MYFAGLISAHRPRRVSFLGSDKRIQHQTKSLKLVRFTGFQATTRNNAHPKEAR